MGDDAVRIILGSLELKQAVAPLDLGRVLFVPTAANGLADRDAVVSVYRRQLEQLGLDVIDHDLDQPGASEVALPDRLTAVCCSGGDPYRLLDACRRSGFDQRLAALGDAGVLYIGASAGALVAGPSLDPIRDVTPFARPPTLDTTGLGLTRTLVLPHDDRPGRRAAHAAAQSAHGSHHHMIAITDTETVELTASRWRLTDHRTGRTVRPAEPADAAGIARCCVEAGRATWGPVGEAPMRPLVDAWTDCMRARHQPDQLLVVDDGEGVAGFILVRTSSDADLGGDVGEVAACCTHPRLWGGGAGRRLLDLGLDRLRAMGFVAAVVYAGERGERSRRLYEGLGWAPDGEARDLQLLDAPIRGLRYRLPL